MTRTWIGANRTWIDPEERAYPRGRFSRRAYVRIRVNPTDPEYCRHIEGSYRMVRASIPDTFFSIPAKLRTTKDGIVKGFLSVDTETEELTFTPERRTLGEPSCD